MKLFKKVAMLLAAAAVFIGCIPAAYADSPPYTAAPQTMTVPADKTFRSAENYNTWKWWDGESEFLENTDYYIYKDTSLVGEYTLPRNSRLLVGKGAELYIDISSSFSVYGNLIVEPEAELLSSGTFSAAESALIENYGNIKFTVNSVVNILSVFAAYSGSQTALAGKIYVYGSGVFAGYGTVSVTKLSDVTVTGAWLAAENSQLYIDGKFTTTLSGILDLKGYTSIREKARVVNSGLLVIENPGQYYVDQNAEIINTQSGRISDRLNTVVTAPDTNISADELKKGIKGIDVSVWQGVIDWKSVKAAGVEFAIIRASSGSRVDKMFHYNITEAQKAGIHVGVYHYCYALTPEEAREEAQHFINTISPYIIDYPVMFDFEDNSQAKLGKERLTQIAEAFLSELKNAGYYPMIYSYRNWLENNLYMDRLSEYDVAVAEWNVPETKYTRPYGIWQYSCKGHISGIEGDVDLDISYKDYSKIIREGKYNKLK